MSRPHAFLAFAVVLLAVFASIHGYLWVRLVRDTALGEGARRGLGIFLALMAVAVPVGLMLARRHPSRLARYASTGLFTWMGGIFLLFSTVLLTDVARLLWASLGWAVATASGRAAVPPDPARRAFLARSLAGGAVALAGAAGAAAVREATAPPRVKEVPVKLARLPSALSGYTLAQITDLHVGPTIRRKQVERVVELTNGMRPDAVVITGDLVDGSVEDLREVTEALAALRARDGVFFVTGNHEYYSGARAWIAELRRYGIQPLQNERVALGDRGPSGASFDLAGVDDWSVAPAEAGRWPALDRALADRDPDRSLVLLAHQPRGVSEAVRAGVELQLSGHTHGGQLFPWSLLVGAVYPYWKGLYAHAEEGAGSGQIYVSCGTGYWGPPMRLGAPAEITKIVLT